MRKFVGLLAAAAAAALLAGCQTTGPEPGTAGGQGAPQAGASWQRSSFAQLPRTQDADWESALSAFVRSCTKMGSRPQWRAACQDAPRARGAARRFFETHFQVWQSDTEGLMTGYYEPELKASPVRTAYYGVPVLGVPRDLVTVDLASVYPQLKGMRLRGRLSGNRLVPYPSRAQIGDGRGLPAPALAWLHDPVDALFLQIQGSGRLTMTNGSLLRVGYADQNGHPYRPVGRWLTAHTNIPSSQMSMQKIRQWARNNPSRASEMINYDASYVFFRRLDLPSDLGPVGAQGLPLTPKASVAADRKHWMLGTPIVLEAHQERPAMSVVRPVIVQDTGGAIQGAIRFDYFWGSGHQAGENAGRTKSRIRAWALLPAGVVPN